MTAPAITPKVTRIAGNTEAEEVAVGTSAHIIAGEIPGDLPEMDVEHQVGRIQRPLQQPIAGQKRRIACIRGDISSSSLALAKRRRLSISFGNARS